MKCLNCILRKEFIIPLILFTLTMLPYGIIAYHWSALREEADTDNVCNNQMCGNRKHSYCLELKQSPSCKGFRLLRFNRDMRRQVVNGHNGLRNRITYDAVMEASDMNLLHWDNELERMALGYVYQCQVEPDACKFIYKPKYTVSQNIYFNRGHLSNKWLIQAIRSWYLSGVNIDSSIIDSYKDCAERNFTQLAWAKSEFIGCAAAEMFGGLFLVCNYSPEGNVIGQPVFKTGPACTDCDLDRPACSRVFKGLCGNDDQYSEGHKMQSYHVTLMIAFSAICNTLTQIH